MVKNNRGFSRRILHDFKRLAAFLKEIEDEIAIGRYDIAKKKVADAKQFMDDAFLREMDSSRKHDSSQGYDQPQGKIQ